MKTQPNKVQKLVYSMLIENTGKHLLDSGLTDNRNWQRNQQRSISDFMNDFPVSYHLDTRYTSYVERVVSVFHYLSALELDEICDKFNKLNKNAKDWDGDFHGVCIKAQGYLNKLGKEDFENGFSLCLPREWNTYNGDSDLSQTLQGANLSIGGQEYILVQIHNGADVRGGYTDAKLFKVTDGFYDIIEYMPEEEIIEYELPYVNVYDENGNVIPTEELNKYLEIEIN